MNLLCRLGLHDWKYASKVPPYEEMPESLRQAPCHFKATCRRCSAVKYEGQFGEMDFRSVVLPSRDTSETRIKEGDQ